MPLPANCKSISIEERTIAAHSPRHTQSTESFFAIYDDAFLDILGPAPSIKLAIEKDHAWAHEAGVYIPSQDAVYMTSNRLATSPPTIEITKATRQHDGSWESEVILTQVSMGNGGINYDSGILFCDQGSLTQPGGLVVMEPHPPYAVKTLVDGYYGRLFNSVNDVVVHTDGSIWFTDPIYGYEQGFRNKPQLPCQVYRFDPKTGDVRVVADGLGRPNGVCFSPGEETVYVTDTDWIHGDGTIDQTRAGTIYAFDMIERSGSHFLANKRLFAMADTGIPDGIKCDLQGNVYSGCSDGVNVWSPGGILLGKIVVPGGVANFCFARKGELAVLNETRFWIVSINEQRQGALLANMGIEV